MSCAQILLWLSAIPCDHPDTPTVLTKIETVSQGLSWELDDVSAVLPYCIKFMAAKVTVERTCGVRLCRILVTNCVRPPGAVETLCRDSKFEMLLIRCLEREGPKYVTERAEACKLVQTFISVNCMAVTSPIARSVTSIAKCEGDWCRRVCLELLRQFLTHVECLDIITSTGMCAVLFDCLSDPSCKDLADSIIFTFITVFADPDVRNAVNAQQCFHRLVGVLSSGRHTKKSLSDDTYMRWEATRHAIVAFCKTWTGMFLLLSDPLGLPSLVGLLYQPVHAGLKLVVLRIFAEILVPPSPSLSQPKPSSSVTVVPSSADPPLPAIKTRIVGEGYASDEDGDGRSKLDESSYWQFAVANRRRLPALEVCKPPVSGEFDGQRLAGVMDAPTIVYTQQCLLAASVLEIGMLRPLTLLAASGHKAVAEAAVWLLRALLGLAISTLSPSHALCSHLLPDLTQLAMLHTSRNAISTPLPRHIMQAISDRKFMTARMAGGALLSSEKLDIVSGTTNRFVDSKARQFMDAVHQRECDRDTRVPTPWNAVNTADVTLDMHPFEKARLSVFQSTTINAPDDLTTSVVVLPQAERSISPLPLREVRQDSMSREDSDYTFTGVSPSAHRPAHQTRPVKRAAGLPRVPKGLLLSMARNDLYSDDTSDAPDEMLIRSLVTSPAHKNGQKLLAFEEPAAPVISNLSGNVALSQAVDALSAVPLDQLHSDPPDSVLLPFAANAVLGLAGASDDHYPAQDPTLRSQLLGKSAFGSGGLYVTGLTQSHGLLSPVFDTAKPPGHVLDDMDTNLDSNTPAVGAVTAFGYPFDVSYSVGMVRGRALPGFARRAATLCKLLDFWVSSNATAAAEANQVLQFGRMPRNGVTAISLLFANLNSMSVALGDHDIARACRSSTLALTTSLSGDVSSEDDEGEDSSESDGESTVSSVIRVKFRSGTETTSISRRQIVLASPGQSETSLSLPRPDRLEIPAGPTLAELTSPSFPYVAVSPFARRDRGDSPVDPVNDAAPAEPPSAQGRDRTGSQSSRSSNDGQEAASVTSSPSVTSGGTTGSSTVSKSSGGIKTMFKRLFSKSSGTRSQPSPVPEGLPRSPQLSADDSASQQRRGSVTSFGIATPQGEAPTVTTSVSTGSNRPLVLAGRRGTIESAAPTAAAGQTLASLLSSQSGGSHTSVPPPQAHSGRRSVSGLPGFNARSSNDNRRESILFGLNSGTVNETIIPSGICCWRVVAREPHNPTAAHCACDSCEGLDYKRPSEAALLLLEHDDIHTKPVWGLKDNGWHWSLPGVPSFTPEDLIGLPPRRALALSVFLETTRKIDQDVSKDVWILDMLKQSNVTVVKDWRLWDWHLIAWLLDGPLCNSDLLMEVLLKSRFMHRLGKLFCLRTKKSSLSPIAQLPWCPANLRFIRVIRQWLLLCLHHPLGRGMPQLSLFATSLLLLLRRAVAAGIRNLPSGTLKIQDVFHRAAFDTTMIREYVTLFGLMSSSRQGRRLLRSAASDFSSSVASISRTQPGVGEESPMFDVDLPDAVLCLQSLMHSPSQYYLARAVLGSLCYAECASSRQLFESIVFARTSDASSSMSAVSSLSETSLPVLKLYCVRLLRALLRRGVIGFTEWAVDVLVCLACGKDNSDETLATAAVHVLSEACMDRVYCRAVAVRLRTLTGTGWPIIVKDPVLTRHFQIQLCGVSQGFHLMQSLNLLPELMSYTLNTAVRQDLVDRAAHILANVASVEPRVCTAAQSTTTPPTTPLRIPVRLSNDVGASSRDSEYGLSVFNLLQMPWRVEIWADYETMVIPAPVVTNVSRKASEILGLSPRPRTVRLSARTVGELDKPGVSGDGTISVHLDPATAAGMMPAPVADEPEVVKHSIPIRCDTFIDLSTLQRADPSVGELYVPGSYTVRVKATVVNIGGVPKPEVLPPGCMLRSALFQGVHAVTSGGDCPFEAIPVKPPLSSVSPNGGDASELGSATSDGTARFRAYSHAVKGSSALHSELAAASDFVDALASESPKAVGDDVTLTPTVTPLPSTAQLEAAATTKGSRNPWDHASWLLRSEMATGAAQLKQITSTRSALMYDWNEREWVRDAGLLSTAAVDADIDAHLLTPEQAKSSAVEAGNRHASWWPCATADVFVDPPKQQLQQSRTEIRCSSSSPALWRFQESHLAPGSVRLQDVEFELLLIPNAAHRQVPTIKDTQANMLQLLAQHTAGLRYLKDCGIASELFAVVDALASSVRVEPSNRLSLRSALWSLANIGSSPSGYMFLCDIRPTLPVVLDRLVKSCFDVTLRGAAFLCVQTMCGNNPRARIDFEALNWSGASVMIPSSPAVLFQSVWSQPTHSATPPQPVALPQAVLEVEGFSAPCKLCFELIVKLSCRISMNDAKQGLSELRRANPEIFSDVKLHRAVTQVMGCLEYSLSARRLVQTLFERIDLSQW